MNEQQHNDLVIAAEAQRIVTNPLFEDAFAALERKYIHGWRNSAPSDSAGREKMYWLITALDEMKAELTRHITTGTLVREELEQEAFRESQQSEEVSYGSTGRTAADPVV